MTFAIFDENPRGKAAETHSRGVKQWLAENHFLRLFHVRKDLMDGLLRARGQARKRERGGGELEEVAAAKPIPPLRCAVRELTMQAFAKFFGIGDFFQAAPIML